MTSLNYLQILFCLLVMYYFHEIEHVWVSASHSNFVCRAFSQFCPPWLSLFGSKLVQENPKLIHSWMYRRRQTNCLRRLRADSTLTRDGMSVSSRIAGQGQKTRKQLFQGRYSEARLTSCFKTKALFFLYGFSLYDQLMGFYF